MTETTGPGRQWLIDLVRDQYDQRPANLPELSGWDDGAPAIADAIMANLVLLTAERQETAPSPAAAPANAIELAYGLLWLCPTDRATRAGELAYQARQALLGLLDFEGKKRGRVPQKSPHCGCGIRQVFESDG